MSKASASKCFRFFNLVEVWNRGISFGMFNGLAHGQWLLSGMAIVITLILLRWLWRTDDRLQVSPMLERINNKTGYDCTAANHIDNRFELHPRRVPR